MNPTTPNASTRIRYVQCRILHSQQRQGVVYGLSRCSRSGNAGGLAGALHEASVGCFPWAGTHVDPSNWINGALGADTALASTSDDTVAGIPRLRFGSAAGSSSVASASDTVFCLSCHKAHGSKYKAGIVWPLSVTGADSTSGCQQCHAKVI